MKGLNPNFGTIRVIYIIYNTMDNLRYVGQTVKTAIQRFMQHLSTAKRIENSIGIEYNLKLKQKRLYTHMIKIGLNHWRVYPLERIESTSNTHFKSLAAKVELFWIKHLNTLNPYGLNMILPVTKLHGDAVVKVHNQTLAQCDIKDKNHNHSALVAYTVRHFASRNYRYRIPYVRQI